MNPVARNEAKYQFIKLVKSGRTLSETKALTKSAAAGLHSEYTSEKDLRALEALENINHLLLTRAHAVELMELKLKASRAYISGRDEAIAKWGTRYRGNLPLDWKRDGNLIRKGKPNKPRPCSSRKPYRKVGKTRVSGAAKTVKDFETLVKILQKLQTKHGRGNDNALRKAFKSIRTEVNSGTV